LGRLFDAAAAVIGLRIESAYEGQAAMELEAVALEGAAEILPFPVLRDGRACLELDPVPLLASLAAAKAKGVPTPELAARFHSTVADASSKLAIELCEARGLERVALGGGCFQNALLSKGIARQLEQAGLVVMTPLALGPNDGAISYGQAVVAAARMAD
jgi:hydrogenase maturation protein HypF